MSSVNSPRKWLGDFLQKSLGKVMKEVIRQVLEKVDKNFVAEVFDGKFIIDDRKF